MSNIAEYNYLHIRALLSAYRYLLLVRYLSGNEAQVFEVSYFLVKYVVSNFWMKFQWGLCYKI